MNWNNLMNFVSLGVLGITAELSCESENFGNQVKLAILIYFYFHIEHAGKELQILIKFLLSHCNSSCWLVWQGFLFTEYVYHILL